MSRALPFDLDHGTEPLEPPATFTDALEKLGVSVAPAALLGLGRYLACLAVANAHMNLTAVTDPLAAWERHASDALTLVPRLPSAARTVLDVGSGGGVPGVPLAIVRPDLEVTLLEATQKKAAFLGEVGRVLALPNLRVVADRAENAARSALARSFDVVVARAVARLPTLVSWTEPFLGEEGRLALIKGQQAPIELAEARGILASRRLRLLEQVTTRTGTVLTFERESERGTGPAPGARRE